MHDEPLLPRRLTLLGKAMRPVWLKLNAQLDMPVRHGSTVPVMSGVVSHHLGKLLRATDELSDRVNGLMRDVVSNEAASELDVYRAASRFNAVLDDLLAGRHAVRALATEGMDTAVRDLLAGVYRHTLVEFRDWLGDSIKTLANPVATFKKRGLPTSGEVELPLTLKLTGAPQLAELSLWMRCHQVSPPVTEYQPPPSSGFGFWGTLGTILIAWGIGGALSGGNDCG